MARLTSRRSGEIWGAWVRMYFGIGACASSTWPMKTSMGISRKAGPGIPETAWRMASSTYSGIRWVS